MNLAILIDAENVEPVHADFIFSHASSLGDILHKEIFGAAQALTSWVAPVLKYALHPNLTIRASKGKNSSDIALVIGAMDLLVHKDIDTVIIASSDSDFSALSVRLRNAGIEVVGMGTDKSNELWRTACTSFVVLQVPQKQPQKQQPQPQKQAAPKPPQKQPQQKQTPKQAQQKQAQPQSAQSKGDGASAPESTHAERVVIIQTAIEEQLRAHGGRMQISMLFPTLNRIPEYNIDKQGSGKKPQNYLTSIYGRAFRFEDNWISLKEMPRLLEAAPEAPAEAETAEVMDEVDEVEVVEAAEPVEEIAEPQPEPAEDKPEQVTLEIADEAAETPDADDAQPGEGDPLALLLAAGLPEDVAPQIVQIFTESTDKREAYNRLRTTFGNTTGREYYQKVKEIAAQM